jgi:23S rRNA (cytidine1920-2'-O)/16S rRNA (cytidine1409-2'-O)-methyltransferase
VSKRRLDVELVDRGLVATREKARRAVMAGLVRVDGLRVDKPGTQVNAGVRIEVEGPAEPYASRAGRKLEAAIQRFELSIDGLVVLDVGASTGGFTDCLLQHGARRVYAVDVGYGQLDQSLREDPRVIVMERVNARHLPADALPERVDAITVDVSFISLLKVVPALLAHLKEGGWMLALIKPQFEASRAEVGKGGIIRDEALRHDIVARVVRGLESLGLERHEVMDSPVAGRGGNIESLALFDWGGK